MSVSWATLLIVRDNVNYEAARPVLHGSQSRRETTALSTERSTNIWVEEVLDQWYGPEHAFFKLRADDGNLHILRHETSVPDGEWELVSFREANPT